MILSTSQKTFIIAALVFLFGFILFNTFTKEEAIEDGAVVEEKMEVNGQEILILLEKFNSVNINTKFFESPLFIKLTDFGVKLTPEAQGRPNPFAPIGFDIFTSTQISTQPSSTTTSR